ncbi:MAG: inositol monophosphatase family protein [Thermoguttaceae bacterium]
MLQEYEDAAIWTAWHAGNLLRDKLGRVAYREKKQYDLVTDADTAAQALIKDALLTKFPDHRFVGEEGDDEKSIAALRWIVDPIDGTTNFVHQVPFFCVSIALADENDSLLCGVIYDPMADEMFSATRGGGARRNRKWPIRTSGIETLDQALVSVSFPTSDAADSPAMKMLTAIISQTQAIRRTGSTALNLAYVAAGRFDACWGFSANAWDFGAGALLVQEAGGTITTTRGDATNLLAQKTYLAAATPTLHQSVLDLMQRTVYA